MTLKRLSSTEILVRLEHIYQLGEDPVLSKQVTVDLTHAMTLGISAIQEMGLAANKDLPGQGQGQSVTLRYFAYGDLFFSRV